jgi:hypothetical protein
MLTEQSGSWVAESCHLFTTLRHVSGVLVHLLICLSLHSEWFSSSFHCPLVRFYTLLVSAFLRLGFITRMTSLLRENSCLLTSECDLPWLWDMVTSTHFINLLEVLLWSCLRHYVLFSLLQ